MDKKVLRKKYLAQRMLMTEQDLQARSQKICEHLLDFCLKHDKISQVFFFHPMRKEPEIQKLALQLSASYKLALPRISNKQMEFRQWDLKIPLIKNSFEIHEPHKDAEIMKADEHTIVFVPNLAVDKNGYRLGYGAGFYDKFLSEHSHALSIAINFSEFLVETLPRDSWDRKVKWICTELGILRSEGAFVLE